ncbi:MAG: DUF2079 domain-containing protein, partial [Candidatus Dormibacteraceae bacterium]
VLLAIAGVPIFLYGAQRLGPIAVLGFQAAFYVYWGILAGVLFDFHHVVFAVTAVSGALYAAETRRNRLLVACVAVAMLSREDTALTLVALGVYIAIAQRRWILGVALAAINAAWFLLLLRVVMPWLAGIAYRHWSYTALGTGPLLAVRHILLDPIGSVELLFKPITKIRVWLASFGGWLFLPLISPLLIVVLPSFLERFWNDGPDFWTFHMQYSMPAAPILAFAAIDGAGRLARLLPRLDARAWGLRIGLAVLAVSAVLSVAVNPLAELGTYVSGSTPADIQSCLDLIPPDASVSASQELLPHLATRDVLYGIPAQVPGQAVAGPLLLNADFIAIDVASDGNSEQDLRTVVKTAMADGFGVVCSKELAVVLSRGAVGPSLTPQLERWLAGDCSGRACLSS